MTSISGSFTPCEASSAQGDLFALQYTCNGPGCSEANGLMGTTCTGGGSSWSCTNGVMSTDKTGLTLEFQYLVENKKLTSYSNHCSFSNCDFVISATSNDTFAIPADTDHCPELLGNGGTSTSKQGSTTQKTTSKPGSTTQKATLTASTASTKSITSVSKITTVITTTLGSGATITTTSISTSSPISTGQPSVSLGLASSRVHRQTFVIFFTFWILFFLFTQVTGISATFLDDAIPRSSQIREIEFVSEFSPAVQTTALILRQSVNTEKEALVTLKDLFKSYFVDKALEIPGDESGAIDSFVDKILKTACDLLISVPGEAISTLFKKTFIQDCILDAFEILWPAVVAGPEFMIPAILVGSTTICYWMLGKFISTVLQANEIKDLVCTPLAQPESTTEPVTQPPATSTPTTVKLTSTVTEPLSTTTKSPVSSSTTSTTTSPTSTTTKPVSTSTTHEPVSTTTEPPVSSATPKSGWTLSFPDSKYFTNDIDVDLNAAGLYLTVNGVKTVNTKCVSGVNFQVAGSPITVKRGSNYVFETKKEPDPDTCCLEYYSNANCAETAGQFQTRCEGVQELSPIDVLSWKIYGCTGVWTGVAA